MILPADRENASSPALSINITNLFTSIQAGKFESEKTLSVPNPAQTIYTHKLRNMQKPTLG